MTPALHHVGEARSPVVTVDDVTRNVGSIVELAASMAPFPEATGTYYPGLRRAIVPSDAAYQYVERLLESIAGFIGGAFDVDRFELIGASFSMVTVAAERLSPAQRAPHFDSTDPDYLAVLHYLAPTQGTAFYRQRATGIEVVDEANAARFVAAAQQAAVDAHGYIAGSTNDYEQIGSVKGVSDRVVIYRGAALHSGIISPDRSLDVDPRIGRLTANLFIQAHRA